MTRHFYEIRDMKGKLIGELSAVGIDILETSVTDTKYVIHVESQDLQMSPILSLPAGCMIRQMV